MFSLAQYISRKERVGEASQVSVLKVATEIKCGSICKLRIWLKTKQDSEGILTLETVLQMKTDSWLESSLLKYQFVKNSDLFCGTEFSCSFFCDHKSPTGDKLQVLTKGTSMD